MRQSLSRHFDRLWFDCLNGDSRETGKLTPDGNPDPSVFSTEWNREGIRLGTAIATLVRKSNDPNPHVLFRHFWGTQKREELFASLSAPDFDAQYQATEPNKDNRYSFKPSNISNSYIRWPLLIELCNRPPFPGIAEDRGKALIAMDECTIKERMLHYFDSKLSWEDVEKLHSGPIHDVPRFNARACREKLLKEGFRRNQIVRFMMRPYDLQWCYYSPTRPLWREPRPDYWHYYHIGSPCIVSRLKAQKDNEGPPITFSRQLCDYHMMPPNSSVFPYILLAEKSKTDQMLLSSASVGFTANLSPMARSYLAGLGLPDPDADAATAELIWMHALAIGYSPAYLSENADGIRQDWPRIPLPQDKTALLASAALGRQVAALLDTETPVDGVTTGTIRPELRDIAFFRHADGKAADPAAGDLDLTAGWGHAGKGGVTMPGRGKTAPHGPHALDVYLNDSTCWRNVPQAVWDFTIGGYQVIKKWLSYREKPLLGRPLAVAEVRYVTEMARRLSALLSLQPALDANYRASR